MALRTAIRDVLTTQAAVPPEEVLEYANVADLRAGLRLRFAPALPTVRELLDAASNGSLDGWLAAKWRALTPTVLSAGMLNAALASQSSRSQTLSHKQLRAESVVDVLTEAQVKAWLTLCSCAVDDRYEGPLEQDLMAYVAEGAILPDAAERFFALIDVPDSSSLGPHSALGPSLDFYVVEAVRASVCAAASRDNPRSVLWGRLFFDFELARDPSTYARYTISDDRAQQTVSYEGIWDALAHVPTNQLVRARGALREAVDRIASRAGHSDIVDEFVREGIAAAASADDALEAAYGSLRRAADIDAVMECLSVARRPLVRERRVDDLVRLGDAAIEIAPEHAGRACVETWLGSALTDSDRPGRFLARVGPRAAAWESKLEASVRLALWLERLKALNRAAETTQHYFDEFCEQCEQVDDLLLSTAATRFERVRDREHAIFMRDHGRPDEAASELERLVSGSFGTERIETLRCLVDTYTMVGRERDAIHSLEDAMAVAAAMRLDVVEALRRTRAQLLPLVGREREALKELMSLPVENVPHRRMLFDEARAWRNLVACEPALLEDKAIAQRLELLLARVEDLAMPDEPFAATAINVAAELRETVAPGKAEAAWARVLALDRENNAVPWPVTSVTMARYAYSRGEHARGREHLAELPDAVGLMVGLSSDIGAVSNVLSFAGQRLRPLADLLLSEADPSWEDVRLVAEFQRDWILRAQGLTQAAIRRTPWVRDGARPLSNRSLAQLAPRQGQIAIVEWLEGEKCFTCLCTTISADGTVTTITVEPPEVDLARTGRRINSRLAGWHGGRVGDPFDTPEWKVAEKWLVAHLEELLDVGDHVVFIEHPRTSGIPWHVASRRWTTSYSASWTRILSVAEAHPVGSPATLGLVFVPRFGEDPEALEALQRSADHTTMVSRQAGMRLSQAGAEECDEEEFARVMREADVAKLLCHGFISPMDGEVALMLADRRTLPLANAVASASEVGRRHRMTWRKCQALARTPAVVFSAACSTGISHAAGFGERLGLPGALFAAGTSSLIAPRWDILARSVLPTLDDAVEQFLSTDVSLAAALHRACKAAEKTQARWLAWSLALEGDWR